MSHFVHLLMVSLVFTLGCAPRFILRPTGDKIFARDGKDFSFAENDSCRIEAAFLDEKVDSTLIEFHLYSKKDKASMISHDQFRLEGSPFPAQKSIAVNPVSHKKKFEEEVSLTEKRLSAPTWDGVNEIHDFLVTDKADETIEKSKNAYADNKKERERLSKRVELLKRELTFLGERGFNQASLEPLGSQTGILIFSTPYVKEGDAAMILENSACQLQLQFAARISKSSLF